MCKFLFPAFSFHRSAVFEVLLESDNVTGCRYGRLKPAPEAVMGLIYWTKDGCSLLNGGQLAVSCF